MNHRIPTLIRLAELEARFDGPIPAAERRALPFGSAVAADIAGTRAEIAFFRAMIERTRRAGKAWLSRGNREMATHASADSRLYLAAWRDRRRRLAELLHNATHESKQQEMRVISAQQRTLAAIASTIVAPLVDGFRETNP